jgi:branched-subunit amino acid ABC-type transport system permease component
VSDFLQYTVFGIMLGAGYAIAATGLVVTYTTSGVFNFAQGAVGMVAAFCYWELVSAHNVPVLLSLVIILVVGASIAGALVERVLMRRLHGASAERPVMVTLGLLVILTGVATITWSPTTERQVNNMVSGQFRLVGINIQYQEVLIIGVALAVAIALRALFYSTRTGYALRAVVDDPELLAMSGVSPNRMSQYGWILGFMMAALAGVLLAPTQTTGISIEAMTLLVVNGYAAAIVGRLKNIPVTFAAAIAIGLAENYVINYILPHVPQNLVPDITYALPMVFLFIALVTLPSVRLRAVGRLTTMRAPRVAGGKESLVAGAAFFVVAIAAALIFNNTAVNGTTLLSLGALVMSLGIVGLSLVLLTGYSGQVSLCQFSFMGIGAFVMGKIAGGGSLLGLLGAGLVCAALGALIALPTIRLRGHRVLPRQPHLWQRWHPHRSHHPPGLELRWRQGRVLDGHRLFRAGRLDGAGHPAEPVRPPAGGAQRLTGGLRHGRSQHRLHQGGGVRHRRCHGRVGRSALRDGPGRGRYHGLRHLPGHHFRALRHHLEHPDCHRRILGRGHLRRLEPGLAQRRRTVRRRRDHPHRSCRRRRARHRSPPVPAALGRSGLG